MSDVTPIIDLGKMSATDRAVMELHLRVLMLGLSAAGRNDELGFASLSRQLHGCMASVNGNRPTRNWRDEKDGHRIEAFNIADPAQRKQLTIAVLRRALEIAEGAA